MTMRDGWVDVRVRLPERYVVVLLWDDQAREAFAGSWQGGDDWTDAEGGEAYDVTHWQPIEGPGE